ncbi:hypothetical protein [Roseofilum capinflatum]|uniref:YubB ferredoxin-like domain-containing protein n=1 Tax=Roseofilum capinflatum BLCC-M114 TaxID=3022440 RepID=A0ABT7B7V1_9CYAN|nr:hypothetical protein [Roseofilum capinflatum]MDJ1174694.1 hypothetical protein [Roseofilum capinflatum BLCC-M114]
MNDNDYTIRAFDKRRFIRENGYVKCTGVGLSDYPVEALDKLFGDNWELDADNPEIVSTGGWEHYLSKEPLKLLTIAEWVSAIFQREYEVLGYLYDFDLNELNQQFAHKKASFFDFGCDGHAGYLSFLLEGDLFEVKIRVRSCEEAVA